MCVFKQNLVQIETLTVYLGLSNPYTKLEISFAKARKLKLEMLWKLSSE